ncbi:Mrx19p KNAG_0B02870 [Huiozyma naganishii CBS 8797]|uniref:Uncharacterized protein n=1 Tax=Huiozyma naganishii (strain ATCC MYA-139 / BCRC 22969 / CBS 8797 / KCTC 17520 / NBRC 10181 / NCYC 3082 / Yp74L-3) TaxID=1071383 RepID=J7S3H4_HUIN7|nr:hypothetical protein KNAG_0B02870 [Kazachstania naganishii CBS 8797]CCK68729.1 hypothetical protein KNAG_0B02870 [Kazachstania naganishii CBS 8797]
MLKIVNTRRFISSDNLLRQTLEQYARDPVKLIAIPINKDSNFIYCSHKDSILNKNSKLIAAERYLVSKSAMIWKKMSQSPKKMNKKIVSWVNVYLDQIPWQEQSLMSIPGENYILKRIKPSREKAREELTEQQSELTITRGQYLSTVQKPALKPIHLYYPSQLISRESLVKQLTQLYLNGLKYHKKKALQCLLVLPLTFPLVLIPVVPNIPGFYLAYRAYCNLKAYLGAQHISKMIEDGAIEYREIKQLLPEENLDETGVDYTKVITDTLDIKEIDPTIAKAVKQEATKTESDAH